MIRFPLCCRFSLRGQPTARTSRPPATRAPQWTDLVTDQRLSEKKATPGRKFSNLQEDGFDGLDASGGNGPQRQYPAIWFSPSVALQYPPWGGSLLQCENAGLAACSILTNRLI
jgi:hypothetical protein